MAQQGQNEQIDGGRELVQITQQNPLLGRLLQKIISGLVTTAQNASVSSVGKFPTPPPVDSIDVKGTFSSDTNTITAPSEHLHWTLTHNQEIHKGVRYFTEIDTDPNFTKPHVVDHGTSRSGFLQLPAKDDNGGQQVYYMRSYPQYHGSDPAPHTTLGGASKPIAIVMTGSSQSSLLSSKGSGTASPTGEQGGKGLGTVLTRPAAGPKRSVKTQI